MKGRWIWHASLHPPTRNSSIGAQDAKGEKPSNWECLLKEYELKTSYLSMQSMRTFQLLSAHLVFLGASFVAVMDKTKGGDIRLVVTSINCIAPIFLIIWSESIFRRHVSARHRTRKLAQQLSIEGYYTEAPSGLTHIPITRVVQVWYLIIQISWAILLYSLLR